MMCTVVVAVAFAVRRRNILCPCYVPYTQMKVTSFNCLNSDIQKGLQGLY